MLLIFLAVVFVTNLVAMYYGEFRLLLPATAILGFCVGGLAAYLKRKP
jgi:hypothetical protein